MRKKIKNSLSIKVFFMGILCPYYLQYADLWNCIDSPAQAISGYIG